MTPASKRLPPPALSLVAAAVLCAGCGSSATGGVPAAELTRLHGDVATASAAAAGHDPNRAAVALGSLRSEIVALRGSGRLSSVRAQILLTEVQQAQARITVDVAPAPAAQPVAPAAQPIAPAGNNGNGNGNGDGKGKGHGDGKKGKGDGGGGGGD